MIKRKIKINKWILTLSFALIIIVVSLGFKLYRDITKANFSIPKDANGLVYIKTGSNFNDVVEELEESGYIINTKSFVWTAKKKKFQNKIHPGCYKIKDGASNNDVINILRIGSQTPVKVKFNNIRTLPQLAARISQQLEADSTEFIHILQDTDLLDSIQFTAESFPAIFIPNTYEFWWNTKPENFVFKMYREYKRFWNSERLSKAKALNLTEEEVSTLASIVDQETNKNDEMPRIAGVYINRLRKRIRLGADPTVKFAVGDFTIKRVLNKHLEIDSPYNTYKYYGLPPGPICIPSIAAIDAVLNYESHNYLYFCAKPDYSGYHNFAKTLRQHNANARKYQRFLNKERIWK